MHRTTGNGNATIGALPNQHLDQALPGVSGTIVAAEFLNAAQEEIINVIEEAGLTLETVPATDRSNGFVQLKTSLFDSEALDTSALTDGAVTNDKVTSVSLTKLIDGICSISVVDGDTDQLYIKKDLVYLKHTDVSSYPYYKLNMRAEDLGSGVDGPGFNMWYQEDATYYSYFYLNQEELKIGKKEVGGTSSIILDTLSTSISFDTGTTEYISYMDYNAGFKTQRIDGVDNYSAALSCYGLEFENSGYRVKFEIVSVGETGWTGSPGGYHKTVATSIRNGSTALGYGVSIKDGSDYKMAHTNNDDINDVILQAASPCNLYVRTSNAFNPASYDDIKVIVWYTEDSI